MLIEYNKYIFLAVVAFAVISIPSIGATAFSSARESNNTMLNRYPFIGGLDCLRTGLFALIAYSSCILMTGFPPEAYDRYIMVAIAGFTASSLAGYKIGRQVLEERIDHSRTTEIISTMLYIPNFFLPFTWKLYRSSIRHLYFYIEAHCTNPYVVLLIIVSANLIAGVFLFSIPQRVCSVLESRPSRYGN